MDGMSLAERLAAPGVRPPGVLERDVCELMTPGVTSIVESSPLARVFEAFAAHRVHALLVTGANSGSPLGWVTTRGMLAWVGRDSVVLHARDAITERAIAVRPGTSGEQALTKLLQEGVSHLLVQQRPDMAPEGVVSELDLVVNTPR